MNHPISSACFATLIIAALLPPLASAKNWTQFRGPDGTGLSEASTVPANFMPEDHNWSIDLGVPPFSAAEISGV